MAVSTTPFDPSEYLDGPEAIAEYLAAAFESGDPAVITDAIGVVARAKGMSQLALETGLSRPALYRALSSDGHPEFATVLKVLQAFGVTLSAVRTAEPARSARPQARPDIDAAHARIAARFPKTRAKLAK